MNPLPPEKNLLAHVKEAPAWAVAKLRAFGKWLLGRPGWLFAQLWPAERERRQVCDDLRARIGEIQGFLDNRRTLLDKDVLEWDFHVRSLFRKYLGPDHLQMYASSTRPEPGVAPATALGNARLLLDATIGAIETRAGIITSSLTRAWLFRFSFERIVGTVLTVIVTAVALALLGFIPGLQEQDEPPPAAIDRVSGAERDIGLESDQVVEVAPAATPGPGPSPTVAATPQLGVSLPEERLLTRISPDPEEENAIFNEVLFDAGLDALNEGQLVAAVDNFQRAVELEPGYVRAHYNLGFAQESLAALQEQQGDDLQAIDNRQAAVESYTAAIDLWNSLAVEDDGLLFQAKLGRGLLLVTFGEGQEICLGRADLLQVLADGSPSPRNEEVITTALVRSEEDCERPLEDVETS